MPHLTFQVFVKDSISCAEVSFKCDCQSTESVVRVWGPHPQGRRR